MSSYSVLRAKSPPMAAPVSTVLRARAMRRVTRGPIIQLTFDPSHRPWLTDYLPELAALDETQMPAMSDYARWLGPVQGSDTAGLPGWFFVRLSAPSPAYLDAHIRSGSSSFWASRDRRG